MSRSATLMVKLKTSKAKALCSFISAVPKEMSLSIFPSASQQGNHTQQTLNIGEKGRQQNS